MNKIIVDADALDQVLTVLAGVNNQSAITRLVDDYNAHYAFRGRDKSEREVDEAMILAEQEIDLVLEKYGLTMGTFGGEVINVVGDLIEKPNFIFLCYCYGPNEKSREINLVNIDEGSRK